MTMVETLPALPLEGGHRNAKNASEECSTALWKLLSETDSADDAVRRIARIPALLDEARAVAPRIQARLAPAGPEGVLAQVVPLKSIYGLGDRSKGEWAEFWDAYIKALDPLPAECLAEAIVAWNRKGDRFPTPGQLFTLGKEAQSRLHIAAWRATKAAEYREAHAPMPSPEERAKVKAMMDEMRGPDGAIRLGAKAIPPAHTAPPNRTPQQVAEELRRRAAENEEPI
jgi:hypothetical protein